jgi:hypothetical protein
MIEVEYGLAQHTHVISLLHRCDTKSLSPSSANVVQWVIGTLEPLLRERLRVTASMNVLEFGTAPLFRA